MNSTISAIKFWLNDQEVSFHGNPLITLLDFLRYSQDLRGTKVGCREGDCGACIVILGRPNSGSIDYRQVVSCLTPMANVNGCHIVSIEGINRKDGLTLAQQLMVDNNGTQCGFCTVGFIVSMTAYALNSKEFNKETAIKAVDGNICRCTGYHSIIRSLVEYAKKLDGIEKLPFKERIQELVNLKVVPEYFPEIIEKVLHKQLPETDLVPAPVIVGGGTDLYVQKRHALEQSEEDTFYTLPIRREQISEDGRFILIPANATVSDLEESSFFVNFVPNFRKFAKLISSTPIRNLATVAGNFVNASPIGDLSILFLSLKSILEIKGNETREIPLRSFFKGYKDIDLEEGEIITKIKIEKDPRIRTNFEKVSKRTHLDIASVNSALSISFDHEGRVDYAGLAIGGVAPIPLYLRTTSDYLTGRKISDEVISRCLQLIDEEISPITDVRGSSTYKRNLAKSLFLTHLVELALVDGKEAIQHFGVYLSKGGNGHA